MRELDPKAVGLLRELEETGATDFFAAVCERFQEDAVGRLNTLERAVFSGDGATVKREAHTLKSAAATLGANDFSNICEKLEQAASKSDLNGAPRLVRQLREEFLLVQGAIAAELRRQT
ncbi:MAG: Hpt domain-containing protein [Polyangiaceae bacterium]|nr:Hpt domain-containing protein [Polyangiaceae bacterium]